jgi:hypothetical protein
MYSNQPNRNICNPCLLCWHTEIASLLLTSENCLQPGNVTGLQTEPLMEKGQQLLGFWFQEQQIRTPFGSFLVHDTVTTLTTTYGFPRLYFILGATIFLNFDQNDDKLILQAIMSTCANVFHVLPRCGYEATTSSSMRSLLSWLVHRRCERKSETRDSTRDVM